MSPWSCSRLAELKIGGIARQCPDAAHMLARPAAFRLDAMGSGRDGGRLSRRDSSRRRLCSSPVDVNLAGRAALRRNAASRAALPPRGTAWAISQGNAPFESPVTTIRKDERCQKASPPTK